MLSSTRPLLSSKESRTLLTLSGILRMFFRSRIKRLTWARSSSKALSRVDKPSSSSKPKRWTSLNIKFKLWREKLPEKISRLRRGKKMEVISRPACWKTKNQLHRQRIVWITMSNLWVVLPNLRKNKKNWSKTSVSRVLSTIYHHSNILQETWKDQTIFQ